MCNEIWQFVTSGVDHTCESNSESGSLLASAVGEDVLRKSLGLERQTRSEAGRQTEGRPGAWALQREMGRTDGGMRREGGAAPTVRAGLPGENDRW